MFSIGYPATNEKFLARSKELVDIARFIASKQHFVIKGPHRFGKTSLIKQALLNVNTPTFMIELRCISKIDDVAIELVSFARSYSSMHFDMERFSDLPGCAKLSEAILYADSVAKEIGSTFIVVVDDIQEIDRMPCEVYSANTLFFTLFSCKNITSIYIGSAFWSETFIENEKSPLFGRLPIIDVKAFDANEIAMSAQMLFNKHEITFAFNANLIETIDKIGAHPANTITLLRELYYICLEYNMTVVSDDMLKKAESRAYEVMLPYLERCLYEIKGRKHHFDVIQAYATVGRSEMKGAALNQVNKGLMEMGYIGNVAHGSYVIYDSFLARLAKECVAMPYSKSDENLSAVQLKFAQWLRQQNQKDQGMVAKAYALGKKHIKAYAEYQRFDLSPLEKSEQLIGFYIMKSGGYGTYHSLFDTRSGNGGELHPYSESRAQEILNDLKQFQETEEKFYVLAWV